MVRENQQLVSYRYQLINSDKTVENNYPILPLVIAHDGKSSIINVINTTISIYHTNPHSHHVINIHCSGYIHDYPLLFIVTVIEQISIIHQEWLALA